MLQVAEKVLQIDGVGRHQLSASASGRFVAHFLDDRLRVFDLGERRYGTDVRRQQQKPIVDYVDQSVCEWKELRISADGKYILSVKCVRSSPERRELRFFRRSIGGEQQAEEHELGEPTVLPASDGNKIRRYQQQKRHVAWSEDTRYFALVLDRDTILVRDRSSSLPRSVSCAHVGQIAAVCIDNAGTVYFCSSGETMRVAMQTNDVCETAYFTPRTTYLADRSVSLHVESPTAVAVCGGDGQIRQFDLARGVEKITRPALRIFPGFEDVMRSDAKRFKRSRAPDLVFFHRTVAAAFYDCCAIVYRV